MHFLFEEGDIIPEYICLISKSEVIIYNRKVINDIIENTEIFKSGSPSNPNLEVITYASSKLDNYDYFFTLDDSERLKHALSIISKLNKYKKIKKQNITTSNVKRAYIQYINALGEYLLNSSKTHGVFEFRADTIGKAEIVKNDVFGNYTILFQFDNGARRVENINKNQYDGYWKQWKRIVNEQEAIEVFRTIYDLLGVSDRRTKGQYYTPKYLAEKAWGMIVQELGENFWEDGTWRIWDTCAGTGNLEYDVIPESAQKYMYLSTLDIEEVDQLHNKFKMNKDIFQFDFLNNNLSKLPKIIKEEIENENLKWLFFINPPYVESQGKSKVESGSTISNLQDKMKTRDLGNSAREMFAQFIFNIEENFKGNYFLGLFSNAKIITSRKFESFRHYFQPLFKGGFVVNASDHFQCKGNWPLIFSLFDRKNKSTYSKDWWLEQKFIYNIIDKNKEEAGKKQFSVYNHNRNFRKYFPRDTSLKRTKLPLLSSGVRISSGKQYCQPYVSNNFLATMVLISPDFQQQNRCFLASGVTNTNHNNIYITRDNYLKCISGFGLYKAPDYNWINDRDIFQNPIKPLDESEFYDSILYGLLDTSNNTATYKFENGEFITNYLNPLDEDLFDFTLCSPIGLKAFKELEKYLLNSVNYKQLTTPLGKGVFLGLYQYRTIKERDPFFYGIEYSDDFKKTIETLRKRVENIAYKYCLS